MDIVRYVGFSVTGLLAGAAVGCIGGLSLGWLLALGYHRHRPSDPADAPAYVAIGFDADRRISGSNYWRRHRGYLGAAQSPDQVIACLTR
jgi:hypothetical protein